MLLVFAGCSRHEAASALDAVGSNASSVIAMKPNAVAVSLGVTDAGDVAALLPQGRRFADLRTVLALDGLDMDCWVSANFREGDKNVSVMAVRDMDALDKSLGNRAIRRVTAAILMCTLPPTPSRHRPRCFSLSTVITFG